MPVISRVVSPSKPSAPAMPSHAPEANPVNLKSKATSKPISSVAIHSRCCCRHHKQGVDQKATLKSRSSDSLTKEVLIYYTSKPISSVAIHSRCCCRHHKQGVDQKATLKSRSSDSLTKEVLIFSLYFFFVFFSMAVQSYSRKTGQKF